MKKILALALTILMVLSLLPVTALADGDPQFKVVKSGSTTVNPGDEFAVTIELENNPNFGSLELLINYSSGLTIQSMTKGDVLGSSDAVNPEFAANQAKIVAIGGETGNSNNGVLTTIVFAVDAAASGTHTVSLVVDEFLDFDDDDIEAVTQNLTLTVYTAPTGVQFKNGSQTFTYEEIKADNYSLTAPGVGYYFAGWFKDVTEVADKLVFDNNRYILSDKDTTDGDQFAAKELRPKYDSKPDGDMTYYAIWVHDNDTTHMSAMALQMVGSYQSWTAFKYRKVNYDDLTGAIAANTEVLNKTTKAAGDKSRPTKVLKDMEVTSVDTEMDSTFDLNGHTLTGTTDNPVVIFTKYAGSRLVSSHGQGKLVRTVGGTGQYSTNYIVECRKNMTEICDVDLEALLGEDQRATGIDLGQRTIDSIQNVNIRLSGSGQRLIGISGSSTASSPTKINAMSNCTITLNGGTEENQFFNFDQDGCYARNLTNNTFTANVAGTFGPKGNVTFGAGNTVSTAGQYAVIGGTVGFTSTDNTMTVATGGTVFAPGVAVSENPDGYVAIGTGESLVFGAGFNVRFYNHDGSKLLNTDSYAVGETPYIGYTLTYDVEGMYEYTFLGWSREINGELVTDPSTITETTNLYAVREGTKLPVVVTVQYGSETPVEFPSFEAMANGRNAKKWWGPATIQLLTDVTTTTSLGKYVAYYDLTFDLNGHALTYDGVEPLFWTTGNSQAGQSGMPVTINSSAAEPGVIILGQNAGGLFCDIDTMNWRTDLTMSNVRVEAENLATNRTFGTKSAGGGVVYSVNSSNNKSTVITLNNVEFDCGTVPALELSAANTTSTSLINVTINNSKMFGSTVAVATTGTGNPGVSHINLTVDASSTFKGAADTYPIQEINGNFGLTPNYPAGYALTAGADGWYSFVPALNYNDGTAQTETGLDPVITETTVDELTVSNAETLGNFNSLTVTNDNATVLFSAEALDSIAANATGDVVLKIEEATANANASKTLSLTVEKGGTPVAFNGEVTVTVPAPDTSKSYEVFYNDGSTLTAMNAVREGDNLVFTTTHFSDYDVIEQYSFTGISMSGMTETTTGVTGGKIYKGTEVTAEYTYSGASNVETITASVAGGESFTATESGGTWTVTIPADKVVGDITVTASMSDPVFDIYYVCTGTDSDSDNFYETTPGGTISFDVYVKSDKTKNLQAFDIYPAWDGMLTYDSITPVSGISITTEAMDAAHPHFQSVSTALNLEVGSAGVKIATINFTLSADAVCEDHYPVYFSDLTNLAIGLTPQSTLIGTMDTTGTMGAETVTKVNVSFNANGGEGTMADQEVGYNKATTLNENTFTREGYTFTGWNTEADGSGTAYADKAEITTKVAVELFAQWEIKTYTITWKNDDGTVLATDTVNHGETPSYTGATPTKAEDAQYSYTFSGWTPAVSAATGDMTYTATYTQTARTYTITLVANGGEYASGYTAPTGYSYGDTVALPTDAEISKAGYIFGGWYEASDFSGSAVTAVSATDTGDKTFYAKWTAEDYTIIFKDGDTVLATKQYDTESTGDIKSLYDDPTKEGYTFSTWQVSVTGGNWPAVGTSVGSSTALAGKTGNVTLNALWSTDTYTITYNLDGGTVALSNPTTYSVTTDTFTLNNPTKEGYTFLGWSGTGLTGTDNLTVTIATGSTGNREYTANWQINQYTISFDSDGGSPVEPINGDYGAPVTPPTEPTKPGYEFGGWDPTLPGTIPSEDITVTATWTPITYTVTFNGNGSTSGSMDPETFTYDVEQALTANAFTKTGNTFQGWAESADGAVVYTDGQSVKNLRDTMNANVDLFAVWQANTYTVTFVDENDNVVSEVDFTYGDSSVTEPTVPEKPGYNGTWEGYTLADSDITVHPEYTVITYTITYVLDGGTNPDGAVTSYNIESTDTLPTPTKDLSVFGGWKISYATGESGNWTADAVVNAGTAVTGYYGNVTLTAQWTADFSYVVENYKYATDEYVMLRIADELGDSSKVYTFDGAAMYYTTDSTYLVNVGDSGVFFTLIPAATYTDTTTLTSAGVEKLSVEDGARADVVRDGDVNGTAPVNIADANAVYQMVQNGGSYYTIDQLVNALRLGADMARENWNSTDHRGTLADVNVIVNMINDAANN